MKSILTALTLVFALCANASTDKKASTFVLCKNQKDVRTIRVTPDDNGCTTTYTKSGQDEVVEQNRSSSACKERLKSLQEHLEASQWACRSVQKAAVTYSGEVPTSVVR
jgi:hypothetical protein